MKIGGRSISDLVQMPIVTLKQWFDRLELTEQEQQIGRRLLLEINSRLQFCPTPCRAARASASTSPRR